MLSVGGAPSLGIFCTKSLIQDAPAQAASSSRPSSLMAIPARRIARTCLRAAAPSTGEGAGDWATTRAGRAEPATASRATSGQRRTADLTMLGAEGDARLSKLDAPGRNTVAIRGACHT